MKRLLPLLLVFAISAMFCSCGNDSDNGITITRDPETGNSTIESDSGITYEYRDNDFLNHKMLYEGKEVWIDDIYFLEEKNGAYYDITAVIVIDLSELTEDECQWFSDEYADAREFTSSKVTSRMYTSIHDDFEQLGFEGASLGTYKDNIRAFIIAYKLKGSKYSCSGEDAIFYIDFEQPETYHHTDDEGETHYLNKHITYEFTFPMKLAEDRE